MKKLKILFVVIFKSWAIMAQPTLICPPNPGLPIPQHCENGKGISTDPANPINNECPQLKNNWEWRIQNSLNLLENFNVIGPNAQNFLIQNPFTGPADAFYRPFISQADGSNYQPADGWEMIKLEFGTFGNRNNNNIPGWQPNMPNGQNPKLPYMILYNKYNGTLRFFGSLLEPDAVFKTVKIELSIPKVSPLHARNLSLPNTYLITLAATNLLSIQGESIQPLDQETEEDALAFYVPYTNNPNNFFWFDAPMAYDPCVCNTRVQLDVSFSFVQEADIDITGSLTGTIKTQTNSQNQDYGLMVFSRILGAGLTTAVAIKTGGAIVKVGSNVEHDYYSSALHVGGSIRLGNGTSPLNAPARLYFSGGHNMSPGVPNPDGENSVGLFMERHNLSTGRSALRLTLGGNIAQNTNLETVSKFQIGHQLADGSYTEKIAFYASGDIQARKVKVTLDNFPDYVFKPGYKLLSLKETEDFIALNGHLPEVPCAEEVAENGADLGDLNNILLKKIEEMTLHLIRMEKEIQALKKAK